MTARLQFAKYWLKYDWSFVVVIDEKWFSEVKAGYKFIQARLDSPLTPEQLFDNRKAETRCQLVKVMYLCAVCIKGSICMIELDWKSFSDSKGVNAEYLATICPKVAQAAKQVLGWNAPLEIVLDNAPGHKSKFSQKELSKYFKKVHFQPASSPDFNMLDAGVFPYLEREMNKKGAKTKEQTLKAVPEIWKTVTPEMCTNVVARDLVNMKTAIELQGGSYFKG